ncbi:multicopper oxidase family protein [Desulfopila sp. IMCC35008]|uniref:multicopper oxidase family protein n=1 Tax=Desulfopila sp. IMCC35008 TaxID=2653858 RepID=UPI0013D178D8|nr:multicopper oxidase domain-containing protein [Desulfopila sp. IMCC35008]
MQRRDFIKSVVAGATLVSMGRYNVFSPATVYAGEGNKPYQSRLPVPPILEQGTSAGSKKSPYVFTADYGEQSFWPGTSTETLGYNGNYLGPTIRVTDKEKVRFKIHNKLKEVTTVHWHGLHVPAKWDGGPHQTIQPGETWYPEFQIKQQAATLWYHPHAMGLTGEHVYRGLAGLFIIEDEISSNLPIPKDYGLDDIPLVLQDRRFFDTGEFAYVRSMHDVMHGVRGNYLLVNGMIQPFLEVSRGLTRFRVLNGSNSSIYRLRLSGEKVMAAIASDGGFLEKPVVRKEIILSAGERVEILIDFSQDLAGDKVRLNVDQYGGSSFEAMEFIVTKKSGKYLKIPSFLRAMDRVDETEAENTRLFSMETMSGRGRGMMMGGGRLTINGKKMDMNRIDEIIPLGSTEIWELVNTSSSMMQLPHSMHLHDVQFNILDRNGQPPDPLESGRKDTVFLWPNDKVRIIARFLDYTGIYMYHCHMLEHEDDGMMGQFEVVDRL